MFAVFLIIAFLLSGAVSFIFAIFTRNKTADKRLDPKKPVFAALVGLFFGCCNLLNTTLAGRLPGAVFFPTLNVGIILLTMLLGALLFREKITKKECRPVGQHSF